MNALPNKSRRAQRTPSACVVTTFAAPTPQYAGMVIKSVLPYTSRVDWERGLTAKGERFMAPVSKRKAKKSTVKKG